MKMWMVFVRCGGRKNEIMCTLPATETRKECVEMMKRNNHNQEWKELRKTWVIRRVNIEVEY